MWLGRTSTDIVDKDTSEGHQDFKTDKPVRGGEWAVTAAFPKFLAGRSNYEVRVEWGDVEKIIDKFIEMGNAEAAFLREAQKLAAAARQAGWWPPVPQSK